MTIMQTARNAKISHEHLFPNVIRHRRKMENAKQKVKFRAGFRTFRNKGKGKTLSRKKYLFKNPFVEDVMNGKEGLSF